MELLLTQNVMLIHVFLTRRKIVMSLSKYFKSFSHKVGLLISICFFCVYAFKNSQWTNPWLIGLTAFIFIIFPYFALWMEKVEEFLKLKTGLVFAGRIGRFIPQFILNFVLMTVLLKGNLIQPEVLKKIGGPVAASLLTTAASQGMQYLAMALGGREIGHRLYNIAVVLSINILLSGLAALGFPIAQTVFIVVGLIFGFIGVFYSLITDLKANFAPKGGIGVFFGTFNPVHVSHLKILKQFIEDRNLEKVYMHPTNIPMMHAKMLREGLIEIVSNERGRRIYKKTDKADPFLDYFPTGTEFFEVDYRIAMLKAAIKDVNLEDKVEIVCYKDKFGVDGFYEVAKTIKKANPGKRIHGLHGSDLGGMMMRNVYDESLFVWPYPVVRKDNISATAIRSGEAGLTTPTVTKIMEFLQKQTETSQDEIEIHGKVYKNSFPQLVEVS